MKKIPKIKKYFLQPDKFWQVGVLDYNQNIKEVGFENRNRTAT